MDLLKDSTSTPSKVKMKDADGLNCGICGDPHFYRDCKYVILTSKIKNKEIPTRARLSLPDMLEIKKLADETNSVFTKSVVEIGTEFGPFIGKKTLTLNPFINFPIKLFIENNPDVTEYYLETTDENECCWMMFVNPASHVEEQNLICYQEGENIFFGSIRDIPPGEQLKVWYSPYYAFKMQKSTLSFKDFSKLQVESEINENDDELNTLIKEQQKIVPRVVWNCKFCYKLEKNVTDFARHLMSHYNLRKRKTCELCDQRFQFKQDYRKHIKLYHNNTSDITSKRLQVTAKVDEQSSTKPQLGLKNNTIGGPLLLQFFNDSLDNSNSLIQQTEVNSFEIENYDNQNILLDSDNLRLNVDVIGNHSMKDLEEFNPDNKTKELEMKEFICDICLRKFSTLKAISVHLRLHIGKYFCSSCKKVFGRSENLRQHKCNQIYSLNCPKCVKIFYQKKYLVKHMSIVHDKKYVCAVCKKFYYSSAEHRNHVCEKAPKEKRKQFTCELCSKKFLTEKYLKKHIKIHSADKTAKYICSECSFIFTSYETYKRHLMCVHNKTQNYECHICDKNFSRKDILKSHMINVHMLGQQGKIIKCVKCNKELKSERSLDSHLKLVHNDSQYICHCGAVFKYSRNLAKHRRKMHESNVEILIEETHQCPFCTTKVKLKRSLERHIRQRHPVEYKSICVELNAKKVQKIKLNHKCPICQHEVKSLLCLERHIVKTHPKDYKYIFADFNITKETEQQKKINKCVKCNKEFKSEKLLDSHVKLVHNDSQYKCHCGAIFKYLRNLAKHRKNMHNMEILTEEMQQCPVCTTKVKLKRSLQRHIRQKHPGEYKSICVELNAKKDSKIYDDDFDNYIDTDQKCMDLQKTIENMDFSIDACNDNLLSGSETIDNFLKESSEQISVMFTDSPKVVNINDSGMTLVTDRISNREVCLSMPDLLEMDQEIKLSKNPYILETGDVVGPLEDPNNVVVYVLKEKSV